MRFAHDILCSLYLLLFCLVRTNHTWRWPARRTKTWIYILFSSKFVTCLWNHGHFYLLVIFGLQLICVEFLSCICCAIISSSSSLVWIMYTNLVTSHLLCIIESRNFSESSSSYSSRRVFLNLKVKRRSKNGWWTADTGHETFFFLQKTGQLLKCWVL